MNKNRIEIIKTKLHFKEFAITVKENPGMCFKLSDKIIDDLPDSLNLYVKTALDELGLRLNKNSFWEIK